MRDNEIRANRPRKQLESSAPLGFVASGTYKEAPAFRDAGASFFGNGPEAWPDWRLQCQNGGDSESEEQLLSFEHEVHFHGSVPSVHRQLHCVTRRLILQYLVNVLLVTDSLSVDGRNLISHHKAGTV